LNKEKFLKRYINDINESNRKSWKQYGKEYGVDGEDIRAIWRAFKDKYLIQGKYTHDVPMSEEEVADAYLALSKISPAAEHTDKHKTLSALKSDGTIMNIDEYCEHYNIPREDVKTYKLVTHNGSGAYYNLTSKDVSGGGDTFKEFAEKLLVDLSNIKDKPKTVVRDEVQDGHLMVVDLADIHIGKLASSFETGEEYNSQIAVQRCKEGLEGLIKKASGYTVNKILFIGGNDILHVDTPKSTTTSGTVVDSEGMWYDNFLIAKQLYIDLLDRLLEIADVHFVFNPSNHDYMSGFFLADVIKTYYKDKQNITFDCSIAHRKYYTYGNNIIGSTHGDGARLDTLPMLMADEAKDWSSCKHRYMYTHHVHHKTLKDFPGLTVESLRSPSGTDGWHSRNGFTGAPKAVEAFIHHPVYGQSAKLIHIF